MMRSTCITQVLVIIFDINVSIFNQMCSFLQKMNFAVTQNDSSVIKRDIAEPGCMQT